MMGRKLDLTGLSENEAAHVLLVVQRDMKLRKTEEERLSELKQELDEEGSRCLLLSRQTCFNERCCIRCCSPFTFLLNPKRRCRGCSYNICKNCRVYNKRDKAWLCSVCQKSRLLKTQSLEWFYTNVKKRFKRFGSAKVLKTLYKKHLTEHGSLPELTEGSACEESVCNEGSICDSDSTFYRQSEEHSTAETLSVAMRVAEEAIDEAISKAEFDTSTQDKQDEALYLREHRGELIEELAKTIVQKIISRRKTLAGMKTEHDHHWPADHQTDYHQSISDQTSSTKKKPSNLWRSHSAFTLLEDDYDPPALVHNCPPTWKKQVETSTVTSWKSVDRLDNSVLKSPDGNWIALQNTQLSRPSLLTKRKSLVYSVLERESAVVSAYESLGSDNEIKLESENSWGVVLQEIHGKMTNSNFNLHEFSGITSNHRDSIENLSSDSEANWKPNKHLQAFLKRKVAPDMRKPSSRRTSIIDVNFNLSEDGEKEEVQVDAESDGGKVKKSRKKRKKSKRETMPFSLRDLNKKGNHPPLSESLTSETDVTPEPSPSDGDLVHNDENQINQELSLKLLQFAGRTSDTWKQEEQEKWRECGFDGEEEKNKSDDEPFQMDLTLEEERKDNEKESEEDDEEMECRLYRLVAESKLSYFSSTEDELDRLGRSGEELKSMQEEKVEETTELLLLTQLTSTEEELDRVGDEEEDRTNERLAVKVCRLVNQVSPAQFSSTEDELDRAGRGEDEEELLGVEMFWTLQPEKSRLQDLACLVSASQFSSTDDELDKLGEKETNKKDFGVSGEIHMWEGRESMEDIDMKMFDLRDDESRKTGSDESLTCEIEQNESFTKQKLNYVTTDVQLGGKEEEISNAGEERKLEEGCDTQFTRIEEMKTLHEGNEQVAGRQEERGEASLEERTDFQWRMKEDSEEEDNAEFDRIISSMLMMTLEDMEWKSQETTVDAQASKISQEQTKGEKRTHGDGDRTDKNENVQEKNVREKMERNKTSPKSPKSDMYDMEGRVGRRDTKEKWEVKGGTADSQKKDVEGNHDTGKENPEVQQSTSTPPKVFLSPEEIQNGRDTEFYQNIEFISSLMDQKYSAASLRSITTEVLKVLNATEELLQEAEQEDETRFSTVSLPPDMDSKKLDQHFCKLEENVYMAAGSVYSLESELNDLEECARGICSSTSSIELSFLEEQVAAAAAKVHQSELKISDISARIAALKSAGLDVDPQTRLNKSKTHTDTFVTLDSTKQQRRRLPAPPVKEKKEV